jgi:hypothetical protein
MARTDVANETVLRHFPECPEDVLNLMRRSDTFADMFGELQDAQRALDYIRSGAAADRDRRLAECMGWITRLTSEMRDALTEAKLVRIRPQSHGGGQ